VQRASEIRFLPGMGRGKIGFVGCIVIFRIKLKTFSEDGKLSITSMFGDAKIIFFLILTFPKDKSEKK